MARVLSLALLCRAPPARTTLPATSPPAPGALDCGCAAMGVGAPGLSI